MNFEAADALRSRIAVATGRAFVGYNDRGLSWLIPHTKPEIPEGSDTEKPDWKIPGSLVVKRNPGGAIIATGIVVESDPLSPSPSRSEGVAVTRLGLLQEKMIGLRDQWRREETSVPTPDELIALFAL